MKLEPIVISLLDTDLYKFNMDQVIFHKHTDLCGQYFFKCRNKDVVFTPEMVQEINEQIDHLCTLSFKKEELDYLRSIRFIKDDYVEFLRLWHPIRDYVTAELDADGQLQIVVDGPLFSAMQFEIYLLEIVNEVYFRMKFDYERLRSSAEKRLDAKIKAMNEGSYWEFDGDTEDLLEEIFNAEYEFVYWYDNQSRWEELSPYNYWGGGNASTGSYYTAEKDAYIYDGQPYRYRFKPQAITSELSQYEDGDGYICITDGYRVLDPNNSYKETGFFVMDHRWYSGSSEPFYYIDNDTHTFFFMHGSDRHDRSFWGWEGNDAWFLVSPTDTHIWNDTIPLNSRSSAAAEDSPASGRTSL